MKLLFYCSNLDIFCFILTNKFANNLLIVFEFNDLRHDILLNSFDTS